MESYFVIYRCKPSEMNPREALIVVFMPWHSVSKCKKCLKHVNIPRRSLQYFFRFFRVFSYFWKPKSIYLWYSKYF
jgi:hypothetical protein